MQSIKETYFHFEGQKDFYRGKVRDVYIFEEKLVIVASDRISAFDVILAEPIPYKGQVLNQLSVFFLEQTASLVPNWLEASPDPNVSIGLKCSPIPLEMVIRAYLAGSAWRAYKAGKRDFNGYVLPEGLRENDRLPEIIITPSTKAEQGKHDEEISKKEIISTGLVSESVYEVLEKYTRTLFQKGSEIADKVGLILADTKYEFGIFEDKIYLIDELHTPDSSRYFNKNGFEERQKNKEVQPQRSKEIVRQWLIKNGFQGKSGEKIPPMSPAWVQVVSMEYIALFEQLTGKQLIKTGYEQRINQMKENIEKSLLLNINH